LFFTCSHKTSYNGSNYTTGKGIKQGEKDKNADKDNFLLKMVFVAKGQWWGRFFCGWESMNR